MRPETRMVLAVALEAVERRLRAASDENDLKFSRLKDTRLLIQEASQSYPAKHPTIERLRFPPGYAPTTWQNTITRVWSSAAGRANDASAQGIGLIVGVALLRGRMHIDVDCRCGCDKTNRVKPTSQTASHRADVFMTGAKSNPSVYNS